MPVLRHLQPVSLELKKCSNKYPQLFFKVRIFETSQLVYAGTAQQVFETGGRPIFGSVIFVKLIFWLIYFHFAKGGGGGGLSPPAPPSARSLSQCVVSLSIFRYCAILLIIQLFFFCQVIQLICHKAGKAKRIEKRCARSRLVKQVFFTYKITNCPNNRTILQDICILFARYLYSSWCS